MGLRNEQFQQYQSVEYVTEQCCNCGVMFAMEKDFRKHKLDDKSSFYCPNGHSQSYMGKSKDEQIAELRTKLSNQIRDTNIQSSRADAAEKSRDRLKKRVKAGVCPCCHRTFKQLQAHMDHKHPEYAK